MQKTQTKNFGFMGNTFYIRKNMPLITHVWLRDIYNVLKRNFQLINL